MSIIRAIMRYVLMAVGIAILIIGLNNCNSQTTQEKVETSPAPTTTTTTTTSPVSTTKKININTAILSELDKLEAELEVPALSNKIQASRPYGNIEDLVSKKVITQEQFDQIKEQVTIEEIVLTGEAKDIDYMTKLGLMKGHMIVAGELIDLKKPEQADPHIGHPVEEIYADIQEQLPERNVADFSDILTSVQDFVRSKPNDPQLKAEFAKAMEAIDQAIAALPESQRQSSNFSLQVINGILDVAGAEYNAAINDNKITEIIEYQDSRGFVEYIQNTLYKNIEPQLTKDNSQASQEIKTNLQELFKAWPSPLAPTEPVVSVEDVILKIKNIEKQTSSLVKPA